MHAVPKPIRIAVAVAVLALTLAGCGDDDSTPTDDAVSGAEADAGADDAAIDDAPDPGEDLDECEVVPADQVRTVLEGLGGTVSDVTAERAAGVCDYTITTAAAGTFLYVEFADGRRIEDTITRSDAEGRKTEDVGGIGDEALFVVVPETGPVLTVRTGDRSVVVTAPHSLISDLRVPADVDDLALLRSVAELALTQLDGAEGGS